jgi:hypothetical protein
MSSVKVWTDEQCMQLEPLYVLCQARRDAHQNANKFFGKWNSIVTLPSILIGSVLSTLSFNEDTAPPGVSAGLAIFMTVMSTCNTFFNLSKKTEGHRATSREFNLLIREIEMCILRGQESPKREFIDFIEHINDNFTKLLEDAPSLNTSALKILQEKRRLKPSPFDNLRGVHDYNSDSTKREDFGENHTSVIDVNVEDTTIT